MKKAFAAVLLGTVVLLPTIAESHGMKGGQEKAEMKVHMMERFKEADANGDQKLTKAEIYESRGKRAAVLDTNNDGTISAEELDAGRKEMRLKRMQRFLTMLDTDGDGVVTTDEFARAGTVKMGRLDRDHDGVITLEEIAEGPGPHHGERRDHGPRPDKPFGSKGPDTGPQD